jgi:nitrite reductase/ring-hydroxylating ferredoxin subunit
MEWLKIFNSEEEARQQIREDRPQLVVAHGKRICLVLHQGSFFAVQDTCTHQGDSLSKGTVNYLGEIICPWHNYRFRLDSGLPADSDNKSLQTYDIKFDQNGFFIAV